MTHTIPMTPENDRQPVQTALCGARVPWTDHSPLPECETCEALFVAEIRRIIDGAIDEATA